MKSACRFPSSFAVLALSPALLTFCTATSVAQRPVPEQGGADPKSIYTQSTLPSSNQSDIKPESLQANISGTEGLDPGQRPTPDVSDDEAPVTPAPTASATREQNSDQAWTMLTTALADKHPDSRMQALAALGLMGDNPHSVKLIVRAMDDKDLDVRIAAILAAGLTKSRNVTTDIRSMLDDKDPQVAFAAAYTLWKMDDRSGEDVLMAVVDGERSAHATMINGAKHDVTTELQHPGNLAKLGAMQGAGMFLGPFGYGITAYEYMHKNGGNSARVSAIEYISQEKTTPIRDELLAALADKDFTVRAASAKALTSYHEKVVSDAMLPLFADSKRPVRLTAAAAYLITSTPAENSHLASKKNFNPDTNQTAINDLRSLPTFDKP